MDCDERCVGCPFYDSTNICNLLTPLEVMSDTLDKLQHSLSELHSNIELDFYEDDELPF